MSDPRFYSKKTGRMEIGASKEDRMSTAELAEYLTRTPSLKAAVCPLCKSFKQEKYKFCMSCWKKGKKFIRDTSLGKAKKEYESRCERAKRLPAKNRIKSAIIDSIMSPAKKDVARTKEQAQRTKTILYESLDKALLLKKLEEF